MHEVYHAPKGHWENIYANSHLTGIGMPPNQPMPPSKCRPLTLWCQQTPPRLLVSMESPPDPCFRLVEVVSVHRMVAWAVETARSTTNMALILMEVRQLYVPYRNLDCAVDIAFCNSLF